MLVGAEKESPKILNRTQNYKRNTVVLTLQFQEKSHILYLKNRKPENEHNNDDSLERVDHRDLSRRDDFENHQK